MQDRRMLPAAAALATAIVALLSALFIQWIGFEPCVLCLEQRIPYYVGIPFIAVSLLLGSANGSAKRWSNWLLGAAAACFASSAILGAHHAGVEQGLWEGPASCVRRTLDTSSLEAFTAQIGGMKMVSCNAPNFTLLGLSLAWWNLAVSVAIAGVLSFEISTGGRRGKSCGSRLR